MARSSIRPESRRGSRRRTGTEAATREPADRVHSEIADAILEQRLRPGTKLGEQMLSDIFGVNRPVVRRALMRLSYDRLVEIRPHRGAYVASPTPDEARQVFEARRVVEEWVVRACVTRADETALQRLVRHCEIEAAAAEAGDRVRWIRLSGEFHIELARAAGNERIVRFLEDMVAQTSLIISLYGRNGGTLCCNDEHQRLVAAITSRDAEAAVAGMLRHLDACEAALEFHEEQEAQDLRAIFSASLRHRDGGSRHGRGS
ncbi:MAG: GntR family transcriptional regulator [Alphaproteobacteria bacterium]|nr:MAG: GntR family transcriptional regulator [Alphaproteobacteria bacterium]